MVTHTELMKPPIHAIGRSYGHEYVPMPTGANNVVDNDLMCAGVAGMRG